MRKRCSTRARIPEFLRLRFFWLPESAAPRLPLGLALSWTRQTIPRARAPALVFVTGVASIAEHHLVALAQQIGQFADVSSIGGRHANTVHRPAVDIRADMDLHAEIP